MTRLNDVIEQIETVLDDAEYPATFIEMVTIRRVLWEISRGNSCRQDAPAYSRGSTPRAFPGQVYDYLKEHERRRLVPEYPRHAALA